jgi:hypothetical protein
VGGDEKVPVNNDPVILDRRVTRAYEWLSGIFASLLVIVLVWVGSSITELNKNVAILVQQNRQAERVNDAQDSRLNIYDDRLRMVERAIR